MPKAETSLIKTEDDTPLRLTSKDEEKAKESFERYRLVLKLNMIPCEEFLQVLVRYGILSKGTVESIEVRNRYSAHYDIHLSQRRREAGAEGRAAPGDTILRGDTKRKNC